MASLAGRVALVTGASRGLGVALGRGLAAEGARVALLARSDCSRLAQEIGGLAVRANIARKEEVDAAFAVIERELGAVDVLVNNAAILGPAEEVARADPEAWAETYRVNVFGTMLCCQRALPRMIEQRFGKIVNVSSGAALAAIAGYTAYSSSKAGVIHFTVCLAEEVKPYGITVNSVGVWAHTAMWDEQAQAPMPAVEQAMSEGWRPTAEENLGAILFLASPASDHVTGQYLATNGLPEYLKKR
ncbi:MAG: SDR family oxidoreductase [Chloroflexi bacterium]|nr:SDR family oxidoreductase [Chloroflexota bacterium]